MTKLALITGASAGIGREFARVHAKLGGDLILTARRGAALRALQAELEAAHQVRVHVIEHDLGAAGGADALYAHVAALGLKPDYLINNAGFGGHGLHIARDLAVEQAMVDLNIKALMTLCHRFGGDMAARGAGKILNVGSTAGFMPGPTQAVYFATKAFVNTYSQALDHELRPKGVTVSLLAPGAVKTEFADVAGLADSRMFKGGKSAARVAQIGYHAMLKGRLVTINEPSVSFMVNWILPFAPRRMMMKSIEKMMSP